MGSGSSLLEYQLWVLMVRRCSLLLDVLGRVLPSLLAYKASIFVKLLGLFI